MYKKIFVLITLILLLSFSFADNSGDFNAISGDKTSFENGTLTSNTELEWSIDAGTWNYETDVTAIQGDQVLAKRDAGNTYFSKTTTGNIYQYIWVKASELGTTEIFRFGTQQSGSGDVCALGMKGGHWIYKTGGGQTTLPTENYTPQIDTWYLLKQKYAGGTNCDYWVFDEDNVLQAIGIGVNYAGFTTKNNLNVESEIENIIFDAYANTDENYDASNFPLNKISKSVVADFNYEIDFETELVSLTDNSSVISTLEITDWNWLKDGNVLSTDQNTSFSITPNNDYNICLTIDSNDVDINDSTCKTIEVGGELRLNFYDDDTNTGLDEMYLLLDGIDYYSDSNTFINVDLNGITNGNQSIILQKSFYQEKSFDLNLNKFTDYNYDFGFILSSKISNVQFQVFNELGATQPNTTFMAIDNYNGFIIDFETTDSLGRVTFILNNRKEDYNFYSDDLNFGTTTWTINKPKDAITLADISGNWKYSITGNSYSSATNIASGITKLLLQNTVNPYYMSVQDVNESYVETTFGLISITSEKTKTLTPFLYKLGDAELRLLIVKDYATNQPISRQIQLDLSLYTDSNGLIPIGSFINDSTGTYNIYMDSNSTYRLELEDESFELNPSELINLYHIYLQTNVGINTPAVSGDVNIPLNDLNFPTTFFTDVSDYAFGCNIVDDSNCYAPTVFSLIASVLLLIVFVAVLQTTPIQQTIASGILLTLFTLISFIPIWVFAITLVIIIAWGLFT